MKPQRLPVTRFVPRKSLLVLRLLATVVGYPAAAFAAVAPALHATGTVQAAAAHTAVTTRAPVREQPAETTSYLASFLATTGLTPATHTAATHAAATHTAANPVSAATTAHLSTPGTPVTDPTGVAEPATTTSSGGVCSVPGIGSIGSLLGLCQSGTSGLGGLLNNICQPSLPQPEEANSGIDSIVRPPATPGPQNQTMYDNYGVAGLDWNATNLQCSDMTSLIGNNVAGMVFDAAKAVDRVTITVYQSAAGNGILAWLQNVVNRLISSLGNAIYFPYLAPVVLLGVMWLAWHGLIRKRATRTIEGTIWMVVACAAAIWLIGRPADFTGFGQSVSNGVTQVLNVAFSKLPSPGGGNCVPVHSGDPQSPGGANFGFTQGNGLVDQNANELWSVLVCKPWLDGEFGTTQFATPGTAAAKTNVLNLYGRSLLWAQAVAANEQPVTTALVNAKQATFSGIAQQLQQTNPSVYSLFQGDQWTTRLEIGFEALFAAVAAGLLILLIALTLIMLKLGFLLLLVAGPFFLLIRIHPGFGRVVAIRWFEMLVGVLLKQIAVALTLSVLLYCYTLIMSTTDQELPWALKIMMISLVTVAVFIYPKPFQPLFSSVGYGMLGANERAETSWRESAFGFRRVAATTAGIVVPGAGASRASRWARRTASDGGADGTGAGPAEGVRATSSDGMTSGVPTADSHSAGRQWPEAGVGTGRPAPPLPLPTNGAGPTPNGGSAGWARGGGGAGGGSRGPGPPPGRTPRAGPPSSTPPPPRPTPPASRQPGATRTAATRTTSTPPAPTQSTPPPAPPFWSRSRRRPR